MQELEIEKRFLVPQDKLETIKAHIVPGSKTSMNDVYVPNGDAHKDLRLRQKGEKYMVTRKRPVKEGDSTTMLETTIELSEWEFEALAKGIESNVEKDRYQIDISEWRGELDVFKGRHTGLVVVEFEFQNEADLADFEEHANLELIDIDPFDSIGAYYLGEGMRFTAEPDFVTVTALEDLTLVESLKKALSETMTRYMGSDSAAVVMGLTIGERADIPSEVTDAFTRAGVSHILSVSGLHVSFMAGMVYGFMRLIKRPMKKALLPLAVILPLYCLMTGFEPGVIRASVTALIFLSALSVKARFDALNALSASAIVILLTMPWSLFDVGFQMSFAAVLGIILFYKPLFRVLRPGGFRPVHKLLRRIAASLALSVSANILLIGISFSVFGTFAVYFIPANLIAVPIASLIYMLAVPISFLSVLIPYLGYLLVPVGYLTELLILFSEIFAGLPGSTATATVSSLAAMIYSAGVVFGSGINLMKKNVRYTVSGICAAVFVLMLLA